MSSERELTRVVRSWLAEGVVVLPDHILDEVLAQLPVTPQRRHGWRAWRSNLVNATTRVAIVGLTVFVAVTVGLAFMFSKPPISPSATATATGDCPTALDERDVTNARGWDSRGVAPTGPRHAGLIAAFSRDPDNSSLSVVSVDPATGRRCALVHLAIAYTVRNAVTQLEWSPTGDALAIALEGPDQTEEGAASGTVLIWTRDRLVRVWSAQGVQTPNVEWAPDGRGIAAWGGDLPVTVINGDGSPDRTFDIRPAFRGNLQWSPSGQRWLFAEPNEELRQSPVAVLDLGTGQRTPLDLGIGYLSPLRWIDNDRVLLFDPQIGARAGRYLKLPLAAPQNLTVMAVPDEAFAADARFALSPDGTHGAYVLPGGEVGIADLTGSDPGVADKITVGASVFGVTWSADGSQILVNTGYGVSELTLINADDGTIHRVPLAGTVDVIADGASWQTTP